MRAWVEKKNRKREALDRLFDRNKSPLLSRIRGFAEKRARPEMEREINFLANIVRGSYPTNMRSPIFGVEFESDEYGRKDAAIALGNLAERFDCSSAIPALIECLKNENEHHIVRKKAEETLRVIERANSPSPESSNESIRQKLTEMIRRFEGFGLGELGNLLITDYTGKYKFIRFGHGDVHVLPFPFSIFISTYPPKNYFHITANASRNVFFGHIRISNVEISSTSCEFEGMLMHEFAHLSKKFRKCLSQLSKHFTKFSDDVPKSDKKGRAKYLTRVMDEGFALFFEYQTTDLPGKDNALKDAGGKAELQLARIKRELTDGDRPHNWWWIYYDDYYRSATYTIGLNFFNQAHAVLNLTPKDYVDLLISNPPTPNEVLSVDGGREWATRTKNFFIASIPAAAISKVLRI